jgi:hypothetical protein
VSAIDEVANLGMGAAIEVRRQQQTYWSEFQVCYQSSGLTIRTLTETHCDEYLSSVEPWCFSAPLVQDEMADLAAAFKQYHKLSDLLIEQARRKFLHYGLVERKLKMLGSRNRQQQYATCIDGRLLFS